MNPIGAAGALLLATDRSQPWGEMEDEIIEPSVLGQFMLYE